MSFHFMSTDVEILPADAPWPEANALLVPTNDYLWMAEGPALEIKKQAGEEVELEAVRQGPVAMGEIVATGSGSLPFSCILHAAVMGQNLHVDGPAAGQAIRSGIRLASEKRWERLLVHSFLGTGKGTRREAVHEMLVALVDELLEGRPLGCVTLLALQETERAVLHETMLQIIQSQG
jgi:hypothetical protein